MAAMRYGQTEIVVCEDAQALGARAASDVADTLRSLLASQKEVRIVFAAGESQITFFDALAQVPEVAWDRVVCFNMDDFWDPNMDREFSCGYQTKRQLYDKVQPKAFHLVNCCAADPRREAGRFDGLLRHAINTGGIDILCQGIGTSGHLALCEPGVKHFADTAMAKVVNLVEQSKAQLRADPNFKAMGYIPAKGITMTIPALMSARHKFTIVPLAIKRPIMTRVLATPQPDESIPATIISAHAGRLYLDRDSLPPQVEV